MTRVMVSFSASDSLKSTMLTLGHCSSCSVYALVVVLGVLQF